MCFGAKGESGILAGQIQRLIMPSPATEQRSPPLLIKASPSHDSRSSSLPADFHQRSDTLAASAFNHQGWQKC